MVLEIWKETAAGFVVGVGDIVPGDWRFSGHDADSGHGEASSMVFLANRNWPLMDPRLFSMGKGGGLYTTNFESVNIFFAIIYLFALGRSDTPLQQKAQ